MSPIFHPVAGQAAPEAPRLQDRQGRRVNYLRLSITDRCDFRCTYCMTEDTRFLPHSQVLSLEEALRLTRIFVDEGVTKVRVTGGEPLMRRNALWLLENIAALPGLKELALTSNGSQLARYAEDLRRVGVDRINISVDSLKPERFRAITRNGRLEQVLAGIDAARAAGFRRLRLNTVLQQGVNDDELEDLLAFAVDKEMDLALIEEMPLGDIGHDRRDTFLGSDAARARLSRRFELIPSLETSDGPARYWQVAGSSTRLGIISPLTKHFCETCNRVRVSANGDLHPCLGDDYAVPLLPLLRRHPEDDAPVAAAIRASLEHKAPGHDFAAAMGQAKIMRFMSRTGG